jgi:hypothetical protein
LQYFFSNRNALNAEILWLVCNSTPLLSHGDGPSKGPIIPRPHSPKPSTNASPSIPAIDLVSPLPSLEIVSTSGPSTTPISSQLPFHATFFLGLFSNETLLFPPYGQPSSNDNLHVNFPTMLDMVVNMSDLLDIESNLDLLPCTPPHKLKKSDDHTWKFQLGMGC